MNISPIQQNNPSFEARIVKNSVMYNFLETMSIRSNSKDQFALWSKLNEAVSKHPSNRVIFTGIDCLNERKKCFTGFLKSSLYTFTGEKTGKISHNAIWNVWKELLNPENKEAFNKLLGKEYASQYNMWWEENIAPIWEKLSKMQ